MKTIHALAVLAVVSTGMAFADEHKTMGQETKEAAKEAAGVAREAATSVQAGVNDALDRTRAVVDFDKASSTITNGEKQDLVALVKGLDANVDAQKIYVVSYSDKDYVADGKYNKTDVALAQKRADAVKAELKKLHLKGDLQVVTLTAPPSMVGKAVNTWDASMKQAIAGQTPADPTVSPVADKVRSSGGPNKVVVLIQQPTNVK